jgi:hypothetical protein
MFDVELGFIWIWKKFKLFKKYNLSQLKHGIMGTSWIFIIINVNVYWIMWLFLHINSMFYFIWLNIMFHKKLWELIF